METHSQLLSIQTASITKNRDGNKNVVQITHVAHSPFETHIYGPQTLSLWPHNISFFNSTHYNALWTLELQGPSQFSRKVKMLHGPKVIYRRAQVKWIRRDQKVYSREVIVKC